jgi:hypothetical protein
MRRWPLEATAMEKRLRRNAPIPAIARVLWRDVVGPRRDLIRGRDFLLAVIGVAMLATDRAASQPHEAHLEAAQVRFALDGPEDRIRGERVFHFNSCSCS